MMNLFQQDASSKEGIFDGCGMGNSLLWSTIKRFHENAHAPIRYS
jgi:hypothetical protein